MGQPAPIANTRIAIFADDLTGALDAAVPFAALGMPTYVSIHSALPDSGLATHSEVTSVNLDTRHVDPEKAERIAARSVGQVSLGVGRIIFNKIDSSMRGHPGVEAVGIARALRAEYVVMCPAYPSNGRTVEGGTLLIDGVPAHETDVGRDPLSPPGIQRSERDCPQVGRDSSRGGRHRSDPIWMAARTNVEALAGQHRRADSRRGDG